MYVRMYVLSSLRSIRIKGYAYSSISRFINTTTTAVQNTQPELLSSKRTRHCTGRSKGRADGGF